MDDNIDVPPLEDMSTVLQKVLSSRDIKTDNGSSSRIPVVASPGNSDICTTNCGTISSSVAVNTESGKEISKRSQDKMPHQSSKSAGFGGMKKGFLFSSSSKTSSASEASNSVKVVSVGCDQKTKDEDIPLITPKKDFTDSQHKFDEVQQAMQVNDAFAMNKEWVTDDLLQRIQSSGELSRRLQDPTFVQAIAEFQANPQAAMQKYGDNAAMQAFFCEFCALLGEHFSSLGDKQISVSNSTTADINKVHIHPPEDTAEISVSDSCQASRQSSKQKQSTSDADLDNARVREILSDSNMREILMDSKIQQLMAHLRNDPDKAQVLVQNADSELRAKINCLVGAGLLQFQS